MEYWSEEVGVDSAAQGLKYSEDRIKGLKNTAALKQEVCLRRKRP